MKPLKNIFVQTILVTVAFGVVCALLSLLGNPIQDFFRHFSDTICMTALLFGWIIFCVGLQNLSPLRRFLGASSCLIMFALYVLYDYFNLETLRFMTMAFGFNVATAYLVYALYANAVEKKKNE